MIKFNSSPEPTIGVEIELQIVDKNNLDLNNISSKVLADIDKELLNLKFLVVSKKIKVLLKCLKWNL